MFAIDDNFFGVLVSGLQQTIEQKLNGFERLAVASDEPPAFLGVNLQCRVATFIGGLLDFAPRNRGTRALCPADLSASSSFAFCGGSNFFERRHGLSFVLPKLQDAEKILGGVIQCQSRRKIVAEK